MKIEVKCSCGEENCKEWAIIELQGEIEAKPSFQDRIQNLQIGSLCRISSEETYTFTIGYHELMGSKVALNKPCLVLRKQKRSVDSEETATDSNPSNVALEVVGIVRHKILFKTRPKTLINWTQEPVVKAKPRLSSPAMSSKRRS